MTINTIKTELLSNAINNNRQRLPLSLGFLVVITFMLSLIHFYVEHSAHPEIYTNGMDSVMWAFMQYIGDPGGFAGDGPVTFAGRIISCVIGVLGIAVFAVPAGLIGSGFIEEVEDCVPLVWLVHQPTQINNYGIWKN